MGTPKYLENQSVRRRSNARFDAVSQEKQKRRSKTKLLIFLVVLPFFLFFSVRVSRHLFDSFAKTSLFEVRTVDFHGLQRAKRERLIELAKLGQKNNLFSLDLKQMRLALLFHPWVKDVEITRIFPSRLRVSVLEHVPVAIVVLKSKPHFVEGEANVIKEVEEEERENFFLITGVEEFTPHKELVRKAILLGKECEKIIEGEISEVNIQIDRGFIVYTGAQENEVFSPLNRTKIYFGFEAIPIQQSRLARVLADLRTKQTVARAIDLRFREKVIVKIGK